MSAAAVRQPRGLLSDREIERLLYELALQRGGFELAEAAAVVGWARQVRREQRCLDEVLLGDGDLLDEVLPAPRPRRHLELVR